MKRRPLLADHDVTPRPRLHMVRDERLELPRGEVLRLPAAEPERWFDRPWFGLVLVAICAGAAVATWLCFRGGR